MKRLFLAIILLAALTGCEEPPPVNTAPPPQVPSQPNPNLEEIKAGVTIPEIKVHEMKGSELTLASRTDPQGSLIIIYSPACHVCHDTMPKWIELYNQFFKPRNIPVVAVSILNEALTTESINELKIPFNVASVPTIDKQIGYKISRVPVTMIVAPDGKVKEVWVGNLDNKAMATIVTSFCPDCSVEINSSQG